MQKNKHQTIKYNLALLSGLALLAVTVAGCGETPVAVDSTVNQNAVVPAATVDTSGVVASPTVTVTPGNTQNTPADNTNPAATAKVELTTAVSAAYKDGAYTATGNYSSPAGPEDIGVSLTLKNDTVTDATVVQRATNFKSIKMQQAFIGGFKQYVIGKKIDTINLDVVSGSSLTPMGFNDALAKIKASAKI